MTDGNKVAGPGRVFVCSACGKRSKTDSNKVAGPGQVFVCSVCGKRSKDRFGYQKIDEGWDESCTMHAVLCNESTLVIEDGRVVKTNAVGIDRIQ